MEKIAIFAGSFCPFTKGHEDIVQKALPLFDKIVIAIGHNFNKRDAFSIENRLAWIEQIYEHESRIEVTAYQGLTTDFCRRMGARYLIRGIRNAADFSIEQEMAAINHRLAPEVETIFLPCAPEWAVVSSSFVRELWSLGADYSEFLSYKLPNKQRYSE